jgi:hypothetical protein
VDVEEILMPGSCREQVRRRLVIGEVASLVATLSVLAGRLLR